MERIESRFGSELVAWMLIHARAYVGSDVSIGGGTMLAPGALADIVWTDDDLTTRAAWIGGAYIAGEAPP